MDKLSKDKDTPAEEVKDPPALAVPTPLPSSAPLQEEELSWWARALRESRLLRLLRGVGADVVPVAEKATKALEEGAVPSVSAEGVSAVPANIPVVPLVNEKRSNLGNPASYNAPGVGMSIADAPGPVPVSPTNPNGPVAPGPLGQGMTNYAAYKGSAVMNTQPGQGAPTPSVAKVDANLGKPAEVKVEDNAKVPPSY